MSIISLFYTHPWPLRGRGIPFHEIRYFHSKLIFNISYSDERYSPLERARTPPSDGAFDARFTGVSPTKSETGCVFLPFSSHTILSSNSR